jgi:hypothetical protein
MIELSYQTFGVCKIIVCQVTGLACPAPHYIGIQATGFQLQGVFSSLTRQCRCGFWFPVELKRGVANGGAP